jgi:hypothetical protein
MHPNCRAAVQAAAKGRPLSDKKIALLEAELRAEMRSLALRDLDAWRQMPLEARVKAAAQEVKTRTASEASRKAANIERQATAVAQAVQRMAYLQSVEGHNTSSAVSRDFQGVDPMVQALVADALSDLSPLVAAARSTKGLGLAQKLGVVVGDLSNPGMVADFVREVYGNASGATKNADAIAAAKAWLEVSEAMRQRFNAAGGDVGKLDYGYLGQRHDAMRIRGDGGAAARDAWVEAVLPKLDRARYVDEAGAAMPDDAVRQMLRAAWETLSTGGDNKQAMGGFKGSGARANRGSESRVLHFKDGDAWLDYMAEYGSGSGYDAVMGHMRGMARDISLVERYGPNPEAVARVMLDMAERADKDAGILAQRDALMTPQAHWAVASGKAQGVAHEGFADAGQAVRNVMTWKLGGSVVTAFTDVATVFETLRFNKLPYMRMLKAAAERAKPGSAERQWLQAQGIMAEHLTGTVNQMVGEHLTHGLTGSITHAVMRLSLMNAWTDGLRGAFAKTMMADMAQLTRKPWAELDQFDRYRLERRGIGPNDWALLQSAPRETVGGVEYLSAKGVDDAAARQKYLAFIIDESQYAVINPDAATQAIRTGGGMEAGTGKGELARMFMQFKSFPAAMMTRHWRRILDTPQGMDGAPLMYGAQSEGAAKVNRLAAFAALNVTLTLLGAVVLQTRAVLQGKDTIEMNPAEDFGGKFWARAMMQGGGLSFIGDVLLTDPSQDLRGGWERTFGTLGPAAGTAGALVDLTAGNIGQAIRGDETKFGAEAVRLSNGLLPWHSLWYVRPLWERAVIHSAQEMLNPGYLQRIENRARKDWGQEYWWAPGELTP